MFSNFNSKPSGKCLLYPQKKTQCLALYTSSYCAMKRITEQQLPGLKLLSLQLLELATTTTDNGSVTLTNVSLSLKWTVYTVSWAVWLLHTKQFALKVLYMLKKKRKFTAKFSMLFSVTNILPLPKQKDHPGQMVCSYFNFSRFWLNG